MQINTLSLQSFRVYHEALLAFEARTTVIVGDNAQGKTSILEAISTLARTKSHRTARDEEMIRWGEDQAIVAASLDRSARGPVGLRMVLMQAEAARFTGAPQKQLAVNDVPVAGPRELIGQIAVVVFSPDDLALAKAEPSGRRRFMNVALGQIQPLHLQDSQQYRRALRQRAEVLGAIADGRARPEQLGAWDAQVAKYGAQIAKAREEYVQELAEAAGRIHRELTDGAEELEVRYQSNARDEEGADAAAIEGAMLQKLEEKRQQEVSLRRTLTGPHRDDLRLRVGEKDLRKFGSQGQQRTAVLAMRLAEAGVAGARLGETPLVLLDDCLSELDESRAARVLEQAGQETQLIVTTTHLTEPLRAQTDAAVYSVHAGELTAEA